MFVSMLLQPVVARAQNDYQPFNLPNTSPGSYEEIEDVIKEDGDDPDENIPANLEEALCGGWDFDTDVNGVFGQEESVCPPAADAPVGATCVDEEGNTWKKTAPDEWKSGRSTIQDSAMEGRAARTNSDEGMIANVEGVPGRDTERAFGNILSALGMRRETGGTAEDIEYRFSEERRVKVGTFSGFDYPTDSTNTCGLTTVCRTQNHPDRRRLPPSGYQNAPQRDRPGFFCEHPCQRPLDDPGKPGNWDETDSTQVQCGRQEFYTDPDDGIYYSCGGLETLGPDEDFCGELTENGQLGGVCQDINNWVYILWSKLVHICLEPGGPLGIQIIPIYLFEKGPCGFPEETNESEHTERKENDGWTNNGKFECCSDDPFGGGETYNYEYKGTSCVPCEGEDCRLYPETNEIIVNDVWLEPHPNDLPTQCAVGIPVDSEALLNALIGLLGAFGFDFEDPQANVGVWGDADELLRKQLQNREYISYFREYANAQYERFQLEELAPDDDHKKENIPVACYGMYDLAPEDAKYEQTDAEDKRCVIAAYYEADDGDGDETNFWSMKETQQAKGEYDPNVEDNPFDDPARSFEEDTDLWWPALENGDITLGAFSMINDKVFSDIFHEDFSFTLLSTDSAEQRATVQLDEKRKLSSGALLRTPDDTITIEKDDRKERRTMVEWWHFVEGQMHKTFTPPNVSLLLPTPWTIDLNPLDPLYTPPKEPEPDDESPDVRSETIEVQVQAREDLLGDIVSFMERNLLLRMEGEPIPIVVPIINPTEIRAYAQGWDTWAIKQTEQEREGAAEAFAVAVQLREYADRTDDVRKIRAELPRYAGAMLKEQKKISKKISDWMKTNIDGYRDYLFLDFGTQLSQFIWGLVQEEYRVMHDETGFPWCRNSRFTSPIYSLLDPWMPGRENEGDTTAGMLPFAECRLAIREIKPEDCGGADIGACVGECGAAIGNPLMEEYANCISLISALREESDEDGTWETFDVCDRYYPVPPLLPQPPNIERTPDLVLDFTAFREPQRTIKIPVLKPIQIRIDLKQLSPPPLEQDEPPEEYPVLAPLPTFPDSLSDQIRDSLPAVIIPSEDDRFDVFREAAIFGEEEDDPDDPFPKIAVPEFDLLNTIEFLIETYLLIFEMTDEYDLFWKSIMLETCEEGETEDCVKPETEQDCIRPHDDPKGKCVHFEFDLKERFQRIASRPGIFLSDDFRSTGKFRDAYIHGQTYCAREDWACQLLNAMVRKPREGWMVDITEDYDSEESMHQIRENVRNQSSNIFSDPEEQFLYDMLQEHMFENFNLPEGQRIETRIEKFDPDSL